MSPPIENFDQSHTVALYGAGPGAVRRVLAFNEVIGGKYRLKSLLGRGGMGYVFSVEHTGIQRVFALKMLAPENLNDETRRRFELEGRAIANLDHPNIVKVYDMALDQDDCPFYVMDMLDGIALSDCIDRHQKFALDEYISIFRQIASGLGYAHSKGIVHRDVKPSNIVLLADPSGGRRRVVKIVDFGIAKLLPAAQKNNQLQTATGAVFGSPLYMSPEQCLGSDVDHRSDIYSLGCTIYESLSGIPPFCGKNAMETVLMHQSAPVPNILDTPTGQNLPPAIDILLKKMLAKRPENRYQTMDQVRHDLGRVREGKDIGAVSGLQSSALSGEFSQSDVFAAIKTRQLEQPDTTSGGAAGDWRLKTIITGGVVTAVVAAAAGIWYARPLLPFFKTVKPAQTVAEKKEAAEQKKTSRKIDNTQVEAGVSKLIGASVSLDTNDYSIAKNPSVLRARDAYQKCQKIKSTVMTGPSGKFRRFEFPSWTIGSVSTQNGQIYNAMGTVDVPLRSDLMLTVGDMGSGAVFENPEIFAKIGATEFTGLALNGKNLVGMRGLVSDTRAEKDPLAPLFKSFCTWPRLHTLIIGLLPVTADELDLLNTCHNLKHLELRRSIYNAADLADQPVLQQLNSLAVERCNDVQLICEKLQNSQNLQALLIYSSNLSAESLSSLRSCKNLRHLELSQLKLAQLVPAILALPNVQELDLSGGLLQIGDIQAIIDRPNIRKLSLESGCVLPNVRVFCQRQPKIEIYRAPTAIMPAIFDPD